MGALGCGAVCPSSSAGRLVARGTRSMRSGMRRRKPASRLRSTRGASSCASVLSRAPRGRLLTPIHRPLARGCSRTLTHHVTARLSRLRAGTRRTKHNAQRSGVAALPVSRSKPSSARRMRRTRTRYVLGWGGWCVPVWRLRLMPLRRLQESRQQREQVLVSQRRAAKAREELRAARAEAHEQVPRRDDDGRGPNK